MYDTLALDVSRKNGGHKGHSPHTCEQKVCRSLRNHNSKLPLMEIEWRYFETAKQRNALC